MDVITAAVQGQPGAPPLKVYITINGSAQELQALIGKVEAAIYDGPQVLEVISANGVVMRMLIDRLGDALQKQ